MSQTIAENLDQIRARISAAALDVGRDPQSVHLVAVSKTFGADAVCEAAAAGQKVFGENYVQEALAKIETVSAAGVVADFHLIGHLQSNKVREVVGRFSLIHSVHKRELAEKISRAAENQGLVQAVLIQANVSGEDSKSGAAPSAVEELALIIEGLAGISLRGLMCIGQYLPETAPRVERVRDFLALRGLKDRIEQRLGRELPELSMGMSHDFELAIAEGATLVRVGSAIFGARGV